VTVEGDRIPWDRMNELTEEMMLRIAAMMPERYWGFYRKRMLEIDKERGPLPIERQQRQDRRAGS